MSALAAELSWIALGDRRLNRRARRLLEKLGEKPTVSIPAACGGWGETRAAYRLFDHPAVTAEAVLAPHVACTEERLREHPRVLCIQDTTELDYTTKKGIAGLGPLNYESRWGMYLHPTLAITPERVPLGLLNAYSWAREPGSLGQEKEPSRPLEEKESVRWVDGFARVNELAEQREDTRLTCPSPIAKATSTIYSSRPPVPSAAPTGWCVSNITTDCSPMGASCARQLTLPLYSPRSPSIDPLPMVGVHAPSTSTSRSCA